MRRQSQLAANFAVWPVRASVLAMTMLAFALVLGGGGTPAPRAELVVECAAALVAALWLFSGSRAAPYHRIPREAWLLVLLIDRKSVV